MLLLGIVRIGHGIGAGTVLRLPLKGAGGALRQLPFKAEQRVEKVVAPLCGRRRPRAFETAGDGVARHAGFERARPAEALVLEVGAFRLAAEMLGGSGTVRLAEGVTAGDQRDRLL